MKKTVEQLTKEFTEIMAANGFEATKETDNAGNTIYSREWKQISEVVWYGKMESRYEIRAKITYGYPLIWLYENGRLTDIRNYSSPKRAINAMREIIRCAGYDF